MPKTRMMGAGLAGSTSFKLNAAKDTGGGNKLQGLPPITNKRVEFVSNVIKNRSYGEDRNTIFCINQFN